MAVRRGIPMKPRRWSEFEKTTMPMNQSHTWVRASRRLHSARPLTTGTSQYVIPMNVSVTAVPTVRGRGPGIQAVWCTTRFRLRGVDQPADAPEGEQQHGEHLRRHRGITPRKPSEPHDESPPASRPSAALERGHHVEEREQAWE